jgi:catechol 2,3-dioxygenase-like lactoylglutathione lyase family enzyme
VSRFYKTAPGPIRIVDHMSDHSPVTAVTIACNDPSSLSAFYREVTGYDVVYTTDDSVYLAGTDGIRIGFDRFAGRVPPVWSSEQIPALRLDLAADGLADTERRLLALGATRPGHRRDTDGWIFFADLGGTRSV